MANAIELLFQRQPTQLVDRKAGEQLDTPFQNQERFKERLPFSIVRSFHVSRVGHTPVSGHRVPWPVGALFGGCPVANRKDKIHHRCIAPSEFLPALRAQALRGIFEAVQHPDCERIDRALRLAAGGERAEIGGVVQFPVPDSTMERAIARMAFRRVRLKVPSEIYSRAMISRLGTFST